ncbi:hypothetical protein [Dokdonella sp.]|uniref:hypothetical protein n=1 Tax=Dokdonella sp. TaxID=2291710 RepID=UPI003C358FF2
MAISIHECHGSDGVIRFQDKPCLPGEASRRRTLAEDPVRVASPESAIVSPATDDRHQPDVGTTSPSAEVLPPSSTYLCQRDDGSRYISESGVGERHALPLGALGYPPMSLGEAYGGPNGIGVSAPGLREVPVVPSRRGGAAGLYTWVEDPCAWVSGEPLCRFYAEQLDDAQRRMRFAFSDTTAQVRIELEAWQARVATCRY